MYERILVPTDGSDAATAALHHGIDLARAVGATVDVLYVADTSRDSVTVVGGETVDALESKGASIVEDAVELGRERGVGVDTEVLQGDPRETIVDYADQRGVDLVVLGAGDRHGLERYLLGSVTDRVVRTADVPVLTVRPADEA